MANLPTPPTQAEAAANALASQTAAVTAATNIWISNATNVINDLISQGKFLTFLNGDKNVSFQQVATYFQGLGYSVGVPVCPAWGFGYPYPAWWFSNGQEFYCNLQVCGCGRPCKIYISWQAPATIPGYLTLEDGYLILLEDGTDYILLE